METPRADPVVPESRLSAHSQTVDDSAAWLYRAKTVRDEALRLMRDRFAKDLESAAEFVGRRKPEAFALEVEYASKLTAEYLAESEKLFASIGIDPDAHPGPGTENAATRARGSA